MIKMLRNDRGCLEVGNRCRRAEEEHVDAEGMTSSSEKRHVGKVRGKELVAELEV